MHYLQLPTVSSPWTYCEQATNNTVRTTLEKYYAPILQMLLTRLQSSKTETFTLRFVRFYHFISAKDDACLGADFFINIVDQIQSGYELSLLGSVGKTY